MASFARQLYESILPYETRLRLYKLRHQDDYEKLRTAVYPSEKGDFSLKPYDEHKCIFVHITKSAGTSVAKCMFGYLPYHYTAIDYRVIYGNKTFDDYFKFAFVRNPWDRIYSAYRYLNAGGWNEEDKTWAKDNLRDFKNFNDFVRRWLNSDNILTHVHFLPQHHFICDGRGKLLIDQLAYFETLEEDFNLIADRLGINARLSHHNASPVASYLDIYDSESRDIVADVYAKDITRFGYKFDGIKQRIILPG